jgi:hypothetical protein
VAAAAPATGANKKSRARDGEVDRDGDAAPAGSSDCPRWLFILMREFEKEFPGRIMTPRAAVRRGRLRLDRGP